MPLAGTISRAGLANRSLFRERLHEAHQRVRQGGRSLALLHITAMALAGMDTLATQTVDQFCRWLGAFCGDVAVAFNASGGVCLAGGFLARITTVLRSGPFTERFLDKGVMRSFLNRTPVYVVEHGRLGVLGAANWRLGR